MSDAYSFKVGNRQTLEPIETSSERKLSTFFVLQITMYFKFLRASSLLALQFFSNLNFLRTSIFFILQLYWCLSLICTSAFFALQIYSYFNAIEILSNLPFSLQFTTATAGVVAMVSAMACIYRGQYSFFFVQGYGSFFLVSTSVGCSVAERRSVEALFLCVHLLNRADCCWIGYFFGSFWAGSWEEIVMKSTSHSPWKASRYSTSSRWPENFSIWCVYIGWAWSTTRWVYGTLMCSRESAQVLLSHLRLARQNKAKDTSGARHFSIRFSCLKCENSQTGDICLRIF